MTIRRLKALYEEMDLKISTAGRTMAALSVASVAAAAFGVDYGEYHSVAETEAAIKTWADSALVSVRTIGESAGGQAIHVVRIAAEGPVDPDERPALFVGANIAGWHNAGTEAALGLIESLVNRSDENRIADLLSTNAIYVAPMLNPDAHDAMFDSPVMKRAGNDQSLDADRDGLTGEDGPDDLNGDGLITIMRIEDPSGAYIADEVEPRLLIRADAMEGQRGRYRLESEGDDVDGDGAFNEDGDVGVEPDRNFAHAFPFPAPEAGPWASFAPETKAIMDFLLDRRNVAAAVVFGPANNLLTPPRGLGGAGFDPGTQRLEVPGRIADFLGLDPDRRYTIDEIWERAKDLPFVQQNNVTKTQLVQFIGVGPATEPADEDLQYINHFAKSYKDRLEEAGLDNKRSGRNYHGGGFTPWLYYQYAVFALELDVWGPPKREKKQGDEGSGVTIDSLEEMSTEEFMALGEEKIAQFLEEVGAPDQFTAEMVMQRVESGQIAPPQMAMMLRRMPQPPSDRAEGESAADERELDLLAWIDANAPEQFVDWTPVTLEDGRKAQVGGFHPLATVAPPATALEPAIRAHTSTIIDLAESLPRVELESVEVKAMGGNVYRVKATARNTGFLPTHTALAKRARTHLPVRLEMTPRGEVELVTGGFWSTNERLANEAFTHEWLVTAAPSAAATIEVITENAGRDGERIEFGDQSN